MKFPISFQEYCIDSFVMDYHGIDDDMPDKAQEYLENMDESELFIYRLEYVDYVYSLYNNEDIDIAYAELNKLLLSINFYKKGNIQ